VDDRILIAGRGTFENGRTGLWEIVGASRGGCLVVARDTHATNSDDVRIFVSSGALLTNAMEQDGWFFTTTGDAYAAVRVATGGYTRATVTQGVMLDLGDPWSPIAMQVARGGEYPDFAAFRSAVLARPFDYSAERLAYTSLAGNAFEIWRMGASPPQIDGRPVPLDPPNTYDSPYIRAAHGQDVVTLTFPGQPAQVIDFAQ
jgi:hypothetical protein